MGGSKEKGVQLMRNFYAKYKGKCYAFNNKSGRDIAVNEFCFEKLTKSDALRQFGYTDSRSMRVVLCTVAPCTSPLETHNFLTEVTK